MGRSSGRWGCFAIVNWAALLLWAPGAEAAPSLLVNMEYDVDSALQDCPSEPEFRSTVSRHLGYDPHRPGAPLGLEIRIQQTGHSIEGVIDWKTAARERMGQRRFTSAGRDCRSLVATVGFATAVQIQLLAREPLAEEPPRAADAKPPARLTPPDREPDAGDSPAKAAAASPKGEAMPENLVVNPTSESVFAPKAATAGVGLSVGTGLGPSLVGLGRAFCSVESARAALEVGAEATLPSTTRQPYGGGFRHHLMLGTVAACGLRGAFSACALAKLGRIWVRGVGLDNPGSPGGFVAQAGPRLAGSLGLGDRLRLVGHVEALYLFTSWAIDVNHVAAWTMPRWGVVAGIDLAARFWW